MAVTTSQVQSLYVAYFGRPAEQAGLTYWTSQSGATVDQVSAAFAQQTEYTSVYGNLSRAQTIDTLYQNLFGRSAQSNELTYWLNSNDITVDRLALALVNGATGSDRLLLDGKVQYATAVTTQLGQSATAAQVNTTYDATVAGQGSNPVTAYYTNAATVALNTTKFAINGDAFQNGNGLAASDAAAANSVANFFSTSSATLAATNAGNATVALPGSSAATALTINGTVGDATGATANSSTLTFTEALATGETTQTLTTLNLGLSNSAVAPTATNIVATAIDSLTSINGSSSSAALTIDTTDGAAGSAAVSSLINLTSLQGGSGNDTLTASTAAAAGTTVAALTVDGGAGNDTIVGTVGLSALTLNGGAGIDTITANVTSTSAAVLTVNAGDGNDIVNVNAAFSGATAAHGLQIALGAGNDTLNVATLTNVGTVSLTSAAGITAANTSLAANSVKVSDFSASNDVLHLVTGSVYTALNNTQASNVTASASLAEATSAAIVAAHANAPTATATSFVYGGNTYVAIDAAAGGTLNAGDGLIELTGFTGGLTAGTNLTIG